MNNYKPPELYLPQPSRPALAPSADDHVRVSRDGNIQLTGPIGAVVGVVYLAGMAVYGVGWLIGKGFTYLTSPSEENNRNR